jgi:hypothetical protein
MLRGNEQTPSAKIFASRGASTVGDRPTLALEYQQNVQFTRRETWEGQFFPAGTYLDSDGDADSDQIGALLEYAWDLNPTTRQNLSEFFAADFNVTSGIATVSFRRDPRAVDLDYVLETSTNLVSWNAVVTSAGGAAPTGPAFVSEDVDSGNAQTRRVVAQIPTTPASESRFFVRLNVRRP